MKGSITFQIAATPAEHPEHGARPDTAVPMDVPVQILRASGLAKADFSFTGKGASDPFCEVRWKGKKIHTTQVIDNNLNPKWDGEKFTVALGAHDSHLGAELVIAVYDSDGPLSKGDFLGQVVVSGKTLLEPLPEGEETLTLPLVKKAGLTSKQLKLVQGKLTMRLFPATPRLPEGGDLALLDEAVGVPTAPVFPRLVLMIHIKRGVDLPRVRRFGKNNAYCIVHWAGVEVGRTQVMSNSLDPAWDYQFVVPSVENWAETSFTFKVWDRVTRGEDTLIGEFEPSGNILLHLPQVSYT